MTGTTPTEFPDGVLVSSDAGTPSAFSGGGRDDAAARPLGDSTVRPGEPEESPGGPAATWADALEALEFFAVLEDVAACAAGPLGAARILGRRPLVDLAAIQEQLAQAAEVAQLIRAGQGPIAEPVPDVDAPLARLRISGSVLEGIELLALRRTLSAGRLVTAELKRVLPDAPRLLPLQRPAPDKALERRLEQALDDDGGVLDTASPALAAARSEIRTARERLVHKLETLLRSVGTEGGVTLRDGRYVIPVSRDLRNRPEGIVHDESSSGATLYVEPTAAIALGNAMREAEARASREELKVLRDLTDLLRPAHSEIAALHAMCVAFDDLVARGKWAVAMDGHAPKVVPAPNEMRVINGRHPLLLSAERADIRPDAHGVPSPRRPVVPFDLTLEGPERCILLSGPNTGGKSVLLKAVGLAVALAQSGIIPPVGPGTLLPAFGRLFADIGDRQSIAASLSTFSAHLVLLRSILDEADDQSLVLLDEIGSGTDPAEGGALAAASLLALCRRRAITLATTHLGALKRLATSSPGIVNASLQFDAATLTPTYRLVKGVPGRSYGLAIARRLGLREDVVADAEAQVPDAERTLDALLAAVEEREQAQRAREAELAARLGETEARAAALAAQAEAQEIREATLRKREKESERRAREEARSYLLEARAKVEAALRRAESASEQNAREARRAVEDAVAEQAGAIRRLERTDTHGDPGTGGQSDGIEVGVRVRLESGTVGEVLELRSDGKAVLRVGSLKLVAEPGSLTPLAAKPSSRQTVEPPGHGGVGAADPSYELDLRGFTGDEAEQSVLTAIDAAVLAEQPYLRIIHGKGTGVVRERVQQVLQRDRRVRRHGFAASNQGGTGVTVAEFAE